MSGAGHRWDISQDEAARLQDRLAQDVVRNGEPQDVTAVVGVDAAYAGDDSGNVYAAAVAVDADTLETIETSLVRTVSVFPYTAGFFSFTEAPAVLDAVSGLKAIPRLLVCDAHGVAHPRRFGLASHLGVLLDCASIGCAKTRLIGDYDEPDAARGSWTPLVDGGETIGAVLRTQDGVKPVFVSVGHKIGLESAVDWVLRLAPDYRLPQTTRAADHAVRMAQKNGAE